MSTKREFEGKDLAEALHAAAAKLGVPEPDLEYEILEQGRRGLFGVGSKSVRIRILPPDPPPPDLLTHDELMPAARPRRSQKRREGRPPRGKPTAAEAALPSPAGSASPPLRSPPSEVATGIEGTVRRMFELMQLRVRAAAAAAESGVTLELSGPDIKRLTKKDGELLSAMQFLLNRMARRAWPEAGRVSLVCDGHRGRKKEPRRQGRGKETREKELVELTREVAQQVGRTGKAKKLHPMNAYERRLVHLTAREFKGVGSRSEGSGSLKPVRIFKRKSSGKKESDVDAD